MTHKQAAILTLAGGALVMIGSFLPWVTIMSGFGQIDLAGTSGDGIFTIGGGAVIALGAFVSLDRPTSGWWFVGLLGLAAAGFGAWKIVNIAEALDNTETIRSSVGYGLYLVVIGGVAAALGALNMRPET